MRALAVVATEQERGALLRDVQIAPVRIGPYDGCRTATSEVLVCGIGPAAAAATTATALALGSYDVVLSVGIAGAFRGTAAVGDTLVATELVAADLGADSPTGFLSLGALGWQDDTVPVESTWLQAVLSQLGEVVTGPLLTVSTVTGTRARADELAARHGAVGEAMEGWGALVAAAPHGVPVVEVRTVSNLIGDRDPLAWDITTAFDALAVVGRALLEQAWR